MHIMLVWKAWPVEALKTTSNQDPAYGLGLQ